MATSQKTGCRVVLGICGAIMLIGMTSCGPSAPAQKAMGLQWGMSKEATFAVVRKSGTPVRFYMESFEPGGYSYKDAIKACTTFNIYYGDRKGEQFTISKNDDKVDVWREGVEYSIPKKDWPSTYLENKTKNTIIPTALFFHDNKLFGIYERISANIAAENLGDTSRSICELLKAANKGGKISKNGDFHDYVLSSKNDTIVTVYAYPDVNLSRANDETGVYYFDTAVLENLIKMKR